MIRQSRPSRGRRSGVVLLVVLAMLTLFATLAVAFVTLSESTTSQFALNKAEQTVTRPDPDLLFNYGISQLLFDTRNRNSHLWGQSLVRNMYGNSGNIPYNGTGRLHRQGPSPLITDAATAAVMALPLYNSAVPAPGTPVPPDHYYLTNNAQRNLTELYVGAPNTSYTYPDHNHAYLGSMTADGRVLARSFVRSGTQPIVNSDGSFGGNVTWPNGFNPFVPIYSTGGPPVFDPSVYMDFWSNPNYVPPGLNPALFTGATGAAFKRMMTLRPGPWDHPNFAAPDDLGGDVKNLPPGYRTQINTPAGPIFANNDSYWVDLDFPIQTDPLTGRRFKPLFAFFITDLDNRVNVNTAGNVRAFHPVAGLIHGSNAGIGNWEVNLRRLSVPPLFGAGLPTPAAYQQEWLNLFGGKITSGAAGVSGEAEHGRYGVDLANNNTDPKPRLIGPLPNNYLMHHLFQPAHVYAQMNLDGTGQATQNYVKSDPFLVSQFGGPFASMASSPLALTYDRFPRFLYRNGTYLGHSTLGTTALVTDQLSRPGRATNHPSFYNPLISPSIPSLPAAGLPQNRAFPAWNMEALMRHGDTGADALNSDLRRLLPYNFNNPMVRNLITTISVDQERVGGPPWLRRFDGAADPPVMGGQPYFNPTLAPDSYNLQLVDNAYGANTIYGPVGPPIPHAADTLGTPPAPPNNAEHNGWRSFLSNIYPRLDLNRPLPNFPLPVADPGIPNRMLITDVAGFNEAQRARQDLARQIYLRLVRATGAYDQFNGGMVMPPASPQDQAQINALRYLAQIAVNIVDYIDNDDYPTPFNWSMITNEIGQPGDPNFTALYAAETVFGTELPRVVLNEVLCERGAIVPGSPTNLRMWIELYNPLNDGSAEYLMMPGNMANPEYSVYRVLFARSNATTGQVLRNPTNVLGQPQFTDANQVYQPGADPNVAPAPNNSMIFQTPVPGANFQILSSNDRFRGNYGENQGFVVIGPAPLPTSGAAVTDNEPAPFNLSYTSPQLTFDVADGTPLDPPTVLLQRLLCPYLPPNIPGTPGFNPAMPVNVYLTIDMMENCRVNDGTSGSFDNRWSQGKMQPYAGLTTMKRRQMPDRNADVSAIDPYLTQPQHTFFRHNCIETPPAPAAGDNPATGIPDGWPLPDPFRVGQTLTLPFDWLVHLDRQLANVGELLHVSGFAPHLLTQGFMTPTTIMTSTVAAPGVTTVAVAGAIPNPNLLGGYTNGHAWAIVPGMRLSIDDLTPGGNPEMVVVQSTDPVNGTFTADFVFAHPNPNVTISATKHAHRVPWYNAQARFQRFFEMIQTRDRTTEMQTVYLQVATRVQIPGRPYYVLELNPNTPAVGIGPNGGAYSVQPGSVLVANPGSFGDLGLPPEFRLRIADVPLDNGGPFPALAPGQFIAYLPNPALVGPGTILAFTHETGSRFGKINLNTVNDLRTFKALCDAEPVNGFNPAVGAYAASNNFNVAGYLSGTTLFSQAASGNHWSLSVGSILEINDPVNGPENVSVIAINPTATPGVYQVAHSAPTYANLIGSPIHIDYVASVFNNLVASRDAQPRPFKPMGSGYAPPSAQYPLGQGMEDTVMRTNPNNPLMRLFEVGLPGQTSPYRGFEMLSKIWNNSTTRSNTFAVWITVGYFEVDTNNRLGIEIDRTIGRHKRHRMFAIVDRTVLDNWTSRVNYDMSGLFGNTVVDGRRPTNLPTLLSRNPIAAVGPPGEIVTPTHDSTTLSMSIVNMSNPMAGIQPGTILRVDDGPTANYANPEFVTVVAANPTSFQAIFTMAHPVEARILIWDPNPLAPQPAVVPPAIVHWSIIE